MAGNRLAQILEKEYQSQGLISGIGSAMGKRVREKMDIRNALFSGSSLSGVVARKIFGKGYSATSGGSSNKVDNLDSNISSTLTEQSEELKSITNATRITAKNTLALPSMARDMYLVKQNIIKLVRLNKGKPQTKAGDWMSRHSAREAAFENKFKASATSPSKASTEKESDSDSGGGGFLGMLGGLFGSLGGMKMMGVVAGVSALAVSLVGLKDTVNMVIDLVKRVWNWVSGTEIGKALGMKTVDTNSTGKKNKSIGEQLEEYYAPTLATGSAALGAVAAGSALHATSSLAKHTITGVEALGKAGEYGQKAKSASKIAEVAKASSKILSEVGAEGATSAVKGGVWKRFLVFLAESYPLLWKRIGLRLMQMGVLATIPVGGWLIAAVQLLGSVWLAYDLYQAWKHFNNIIEGNSTNEGKSEAQKSLEEHQSKIQKITEQLKTETRPIAKANLESELKYHQRKSEEAAEAIKKEADSTKSPSPTPANNSDLANNIGGHESGGNYNAVFGMPGGATLNGKPLSENTIGEVYEWQKKHIAQRTNRQAAGKYQFMNVLKAAQDAGISYREKFSPENQDKMMQAFTENNANRLKQLGIDPTKENLALAHSVGADGAAALINKQKSGHGNEIASTVLGLKGTGLSTNPHLRKSVDEVIASAASVANGTGIKPAGNGTGGPAPSLDGNVLASASSAVDPFSSMIEMMGNMLNTYHQQTVAKNEGKNFDGGSLETYNEEFLKKLLESQGFSPNKA